jgi:hypothetical protein
MAWRATEACGSGLISSPARPWPSMISSRARRTAAANWSRWTWVMGFRDCQSCSGVGPEAPKGRCRQLAFCTAASTSADVQTPGCPFSATRCYPLADADLQGPVAGLDGPIIPEGSRRGQQRNCLPVFQGVAELSGRRRGPLWCGHLACHPNPLPMRARCPRRNALPEGSSHPNSKEPKTICPVRERSPQFKQKRGFGGYVGAGASRWHRDETR